MAKILVVDDDLNVLKTVQFMLESRDHNVTPVSNVKDCLKAMADQDFDLVITDILMPDTDGTELIQELRRNPSSPPVIAMSGGGNIVSTNDALSLARVLAKGVLEKPFMEEELNAMIESVLGPSVH